MVFWHSCRISSQVWLSPTRLSLALSGGQSAEAQKEVTDGFILVETNYKVILSFFLSTLTKQSFLTVQANHAYKMASSNLALRYCGKKAVLPS